MKRHALAALLLSACLAHPARADERAADLPLGDPARRDREVAVVLDGIVDTAKGDTIGPAEMAARLDGVQLVFVGESHTDMDFHRVQLRVLQALAARGRTVMVGLEMYPVPEQPWLDRWATDKKMTEERFLSESRWYRNWGYPWNYYRDIFRFTRDHGIRMYAINLPREAVTTVRKSGFDALSPDLRALLPPTVDVTNEEHRKLFRAFFGDEDALHGNMPPEMFEGMFRAQCAWDAAMGWNALQALKKHGDAKAIMVVLIGSGHVAYGLGAERQVRPFFPGGIATILPIPIADSPCGARTGEVRASYADFVWGLPPASEPMYPTVGIATAEAKTDGHYRVIMVAKESPASLAGFATGDLLVSVDGRPIEEKETMQRLLAEKRWGDDVGFRVLRGGHETDLLVHLRREAPKPCGADSTAHEGDAPAHPVPAKPAGGTTP